MTQRTIESIKEELADVLTDPVVNIDRVVQLSTELSKSDPDFVRFTTDAAIISRLGRELVAKQETAVAELIKNAYDADATTVTLTFENAEGRGGTLVIVDDGLGMDREQLVNGFMRLSSTDKVVHPYSPRFGRRRAGKKGIGRFAVQRLGAELTITTQTKSESQALQVRIDWEDFEGGRELTTVANRIDVVPKVQPEGTILRIRHLREGWSEAAMRRVYRFISELLQPFPLHTALESATAEGESSYSLPDPGFKVSLRRKAGRFESVIADEEISIFTHALAEIEGYVDQFGHGFWSVRSKKLGFDEPVLPIGRERDADTEPFAELRDVSLKAYYFIHDADVIPRAMLATIRDLAREKGGIRIYRNGFRVMPYGEREDDWLGLDASTRARAILPPHANNNFFGFVEIVDPQGARFEETSSREGLLENDAFEELQGFASRVLKAAALRIAAVRGRKGTASQRDWVKETRDPSEAVRSIANELTAAAGRSEGVTQSEQGQRATSDLTATVARAADELQLIATANEELRRAFLEEIGMLRVLASLGLVIGEFTHEVKQILGAAHLSARQLMNSLEGQENHETARDLYENVQRFRTYASYFYRAIAENTSRELNAQDLRPVIRGFIQSAQPAAARAGIEFVSDIQGYELTTPPMHSSELASILFNFYSNSQKAIRRAHVQGRILIRAGEENERLFLEFADNGDGIPPEYSERIFNPFFTTSTPVGPDAPEEEEMQGTGLGLKIVKDIVESYGGDVFVTSPPTGYNTCLRVELPRGAEEDADEAD